MWILEHLLVAEGPRSPPKKYNDGDTYRRYRSQLEEFPMDKAAVIQLTKQY